MNKKWLNIKSILTISTLAAVSGFSLSDDFPERSITHVFPWSPAGPAYAVSKIIADEMSIHIGEKVSLQAKTGAGGVNAFKQAMDKPADGYTIIDGYAGPLVLQPLSGNVDYDFRDFIPLHAANANAFAIVSRVDETRWTDYPSFIKYIQEHPGKLRYTGGQSLGLPHLVTASIMEGSDAVSRYIPYKSMVDGIKDLRGNIMDWMVVNPGLYKANTGKFKVIAVLTDRQSDADDLYDGAPAISNFESNLKVSGLSMVGWNWWVVKKGTPDEAVNVLRDSMAVALKNAEVRAKVKKLGFVFTDYDASEYETVVGNAVEQIKAAYDALEWEANRLKNL